MYQELLLLSKYDEENIFFLINNVNVFTYPKNILKLYFGVAYLNLSVAQLSSNKPKRHTICYIFFPVNFAFENINCNSQTKLPSFSSLVLPRSWKIRKNLDIKGLAILQDLVRLPTTKTHLCGQCGLMRSCPPPHPHSSSCG